MFKNSTNKYEIRFIKRMNEAASSLRQRPTVAEQHLWKYLRKNRLLGYKFRRQHAIGRYIVDFVCHERKLIIEVDGKIHDQRKIYDQERDNYLQLYGYTTMRFTNNEVLFNTRKVINRLGLLLEGEGVPSERSPLRLRSEASESRDG